MEHLYYAEKISFYIRRAMTDKMPLYWYVPPRNIFDHEILFIEEGEMDFTIENKVYRARKNDIILIPPKKVHSLQTIGDKRLVQPHIHFDFIFETDSPNIYIPFEILKPENPYYGKIRDDYWEKLGLPVLISDIPEILSAKIKDIIYKLIELQPSMDVVSLLMKKAYMSELISTFIKLVNSEISYGDNAEYICRVIDTYIEKQLSGEFNLLEIATQVNYSQNHLSTLYKKRRGETPHRNYCILKCQKAKEYLRLENLSVSEIAYTLGFSSPGVFSRFFHHETGISPSEYRLSQSKK